MILSFFFPLFVLRAYHGLLFILLPSHTIETLHWSEAFRMAHCIMYTNSFIVILRYDYQNRSFLRHLVIFM